MALLNLSSMRASQFNLCSGPKEVYGKLAARKVHLAFQLFQIHSFSYLTHSISLFLSHSHCVCCAWENSNSLANWQCKAKQTEPRAEQQLH